MIDRFTGDSKHFVNLILGPISLICTLFLAGKAIEIPNYDLILVAVFGLYFCAKWRIKGYLFALSLLSLSALGKHLIYTDHHLWQGGFELSIAIALLITALYFYENANFIEGLSAQNEAQAQTIEFLEEDLTKTKNFAAEEALKATDKATQLHAQLDDALAESSSYQILNDVLRKSTARAIEEKERLISQIFQADRKSGQLLSEIDVLQKELARIGNENEIIQQNSQLFAELNEIRAKQMQTHLVNETLARMHRTEHTRVKELEAQREELEQKLQIANCKLEEHSLQLDEVTKKREELSSEMQVLITAQNERSESLQNELAHAQQLYFTAAQKLEQLEPYSHHLKVSLESLEKELEHKKMLLLTASEELSEMQVQDGQLSEHGVALEVELSSLKQQLLSASRKMTSERETELLEQMSALQSQLQVQASQAEKADEMKSQLETLQTRLKQFTELELLYRQLKGNFQAKTKLLHETRVQLFHIDTELQTLKQQVEEKELEGDPLLPLFTLEIEEMEEENRALTRENSLMSELIANLMSAPRESHLPLRDIVQEEFKQHHFANEEFVKKKVKRQKLFSDQHDFFEPLEGGSF